MKFSNKIQTALRLLIVGLLIYPFPIAMAVEQTETESFGDGVWTNSNFSATNYSSAGYSIDNVYDGDYGCDGYCLNYNTSNQSNRMLQVTFSDTGITEIGFDVGAIDFAWAYNVFIKDSNGTSSNPDWVTYNDYSSWNAGTYVFEETYTAPTGYEIWRIEFTFNDYAIIDNFYYKYDDGVTAGVGAPTNLTTSRSIQDGSITVDWDAPANTYQYSPERYAIGFDKADPPMYAVATGNVGDSNALNTEYTFTKSYLQSALDAQVGDTLYFKIRSDNDTNSSYSSWTTVVSYTIEDFPSGVTNLSATQNEYGGVTFNWTQPNTGWGTVGSYKLQYKKDADLSWSYVTDISADATSYTWTDVEEDTYSFAIIAMNSSGSNGTSTVGGPISVTISNTTPTTTTTTIVYTLGPPMNPTVENVYNSGVKVDWDAPNTGNATVDYYELYYRTSAENEIKVDNITETEYTIPYNAIPNGEYTFSLRAISTTNSVNSGFSTEPTLTVFNQKAKDDADAAAAEAARKAEEERIAREKAEAEAKAEAERIAKEKAIQDEKDKNFAETGYYELDSERADREQKEYEAEQERLRLEEEARLKAIQDEKDANFAETGYYELDSERTAREDAEEEARIQKELEESVLKDVDTENLTEEEKAEVKELVDTIQRLQEELEIIEIEEEVFELEEIVIVTTTTTTTTTIPLVEDIDIEEDEPTEQVEDKPLPSEEGDSEVQLTREEVEVLVKETEAKVKEVVVVEVIEDEPVEEFEAKVEEAVKELPKEKKVEVVKEVAKVSVQNLATADNTTKAVVKAVVKEVTKVETVAELSEEEKVEVGKVLGFKDEETAAEDVEIIAEQATKEENVATAVEEYVDRAIENKDVEDYTLADVVTEVQVEVFLENPVGALIDVNITEMDLGSLGDDMTSDQRQKSKEVVVPVIIASQIVAQAGALMTRRF